MISQREVDPAELEREEDCDEEPAIRMNISITIVEEADCCKDYVGTTTRIEELLRVQRRQDDDIWLQHGGGRRQGQAGVAQKAFLVCQSLPPSARTRTACS